jgi:hypothetical protein
LARRPNLDGAYRRALELLVSCPEGYAEALMLAQGFTIEQTVELVRAWLATAQTERVVSPDRASRGRAGEDHRGGAAGAGRIAMPSLILQHSEWSDDEYDVLADGVAVGRIMKATAAPEGIRWLWTLAHGYHEDRTPTHGYEPTREAAMAAFAKSWRRE